MTRYQNDHAVKWITLLNDKVAKYLDFGIDFQSILFCFRESLDQKIKYTKSILTNLYLVFLPCGPLLNFKRR